MARLSRHAWSAMDRLYRGRSRAHPTAGRTPLFREDHPAPAHLSAQRPQARCGRNAVAQRLWPARAGVRILLVQRSVQADIRAVRMLVEIAAGGRALGAVAAAA